MKRILDSLNPAHEHLSAAKRALPTKIYSIDNTTEKAVDRALRNGTLNGKEHEPEDIQELKDSGVYMRRYRKFIRRPLSTVIVTTAVARYSVSCALYVGDRQWE